MSLPQASHIDAISSALAEVLDLCRRQPEFAERAGIRLEEVALSVGSTARSRAEEAIMKCLEDLSSGSPGIPRSPTTKECRQIAEYLSKRHRIQFDRRDYRRKEVLMHWFSEHWDRLGSDCLMLVQDIAIRLTRGDAALPSDPDAFMTDPLESNQTPF
jgi:hypothetical protein